MEDPEILGADGLQVRKLGVYGDWYCKGSGKRPGGRNSRGWRTGSENVNPAAD
jgi:hypothetical protein